MKAFGVALLIAAVVALTIADVALAVKVSSLNGKVGSVTYLQGPRGPRGRTGS